MVDLSLDLVEQHHNLLHSMQPRGDDVTDSPSDRPASRLFLSVFFHFQLFAATT